MRDGILRTKTGLLFNVQKQSEAGMVMYLHQRSLTLKVNLRDIQMAENHLLMHQEVQLIQRGKGPMWYVTLNMLSSITSSASFSRAV